MREPLGHALPSPDAGYHDRLMPRLNAPWTPALVDAAGVRAGDRVLDLACGSGLAGRAAAERGAVVVGLDAMRGLLRRAPFERILGDMHDLPLRARTIDLVLCQQGLQFADDLARTLQETRRVLRPEGRLAALTWASLRLSPAFAALQDAAAAQLRVDLEDTVGPPDPMRDVDATRITLLEAGFAKVEARLLEGRLRFPSAREFASDFVAGSFLNGVAREAGDAALDRFLDDVEETLGPGPLDSPAEAVLVVAKNP